MVDLVVGAVGLIALLQLIKRWVESRDKLTQVSEQMLSQLEWSFRSPSVLSMKRGKRGEGVLTVVLGQDGKAHSTVRVTLGDRIQCVVNPVEGWEFLELSNSQRGVEVGRYCLKASFPCTESPSDCYWVQDLIQLVGFRVVLSGGRIRRLMELVRTTPRWRLATQTRQEIGEMLWREDKDHPELEEHRWWLSRSDLIPHPDHETMMWKCLGARCLGEKELRRWLKPPRVSRIPNSKGTMQAARWLPAYTKWIVRGYQALMAYDPPEEELRAWEAQRPLRLPILIHYVRRGDIRNAVRICGGVAALTKAGLVGTEAVPMAYHLGEVLFLDDPSLEGWGELWGLLRNPEMEPVFCALWGLSFRQESVRAELLEICRDFGGLHTLRLLSRAPNDPAIRQAMTRIQSRLSETTQGLLSVATPRGELSFPGAPGSGALSIECPQEV